MNTVNVKSHSFLPDADQITVSDSHNVFRIATDDSIVDNNFLQQDTRHSQLHQKLGKNNHKLGVLAYSNIRQSN